MKIGDLRRSQFMNYDCMWNGLVRDVTAQFEQSDEEVSEVEVLKKLLDFLTSTAILDVDFPLDSGSRMRNLFMEATQ